VLFLAAMCLLGVLVSGCDPMKQMLVDNRTDSPVDLVMHQSSRLNGDTIVHRIQPKEERNYLFHFGLWTRPRIMRDENDQVIRVEFDNDLDVQAMWLQGSIGTLNVKRRYLLGNGLVVRVK
jgi:hypothetical protein